MKIAQKTLFCAIKIKHNTSNNIYPYNNNVYYILKPYIYTKIQYISFKAIFKPSDSVLPIRWITLSFNYLKTP